jgi:lysophospholipase L1-like esterase
VRVRFLALGDSYTIGEGVPPEARWPVVLTGLLRGRGLPVEEPEIVATTGWTTDELDAAIDAAAPRGPYALVTLLVGVNDQYRGRGVDAFRPAFAALLARAVAFAGGDAGRVVVLSIPDWGVTPFAEGRDRDAVALEIDRFNAACCAAALASGAAWVDVTAQGRAAGPDPAFLAPDGLHPSARAYAAWARLALPAALLALSG